MYAAKAQILLFLKQPQDVLDCLAEFDRRNGGKLEDTLRRRFSNATTPSRSLDPTTKPLSPIALQRVSCHYPTP